MHIQFVNLSCGQLQRIRHYTLLIKRNIFLGRCILSQYLLSGVGVNANKIDVRVSSQTVMCVATTTQERHNILAEQLVSPKKIIVGLQ